MLCTVFQKFFHQQFQDNVVKMMAIFLRLLRNQCLFACKVLIWNWVSSVRALGRHLAYIYVITETKGSNNSTLDFGDNWHSKHSVCMYFVMPFRYLTMKIHLWNFRVGSLSNNSLYPLKNSLWSNSVSALSRLDLTKALLKYDLRCHF